MKVEADQFSNVFIALADPTRRAILARLRDGDASVTELAAPFAISQPAVLLVSAVSAGCWRWRS
jgi:DNA-binding transcriptional ArsR family regulator